MASPNKQVTSAVLFALGLSLLGAAVPCRAQANPPSSNTHLLEVDDATAATTTDAGLVTSAKGSADLPTAAPAAATDPLPPNLDPQASASSSSSPLLLTTAGAPKSQFTAGSPASTEQLVCSAMTLVSAPRSAISFTTSRE